MRKIFHRTIGGLGILAALCAASARAQLPRYAVTNLGALPGGTSCFPEDISNQGHVVGLVPIGIHSRAFLWYKGVIKDLGTLGGLSSDAHAVNDLGQVVGTAADAAQLNYAFLYNSSTGNKAVVPGAHSGSDAFGIDAAGRVIGREGTNAMLWHGGTAKTLAKLPGGDVARAYALNRIGHVVGFSSIGGAGSPTHATLWKDNTLTDLGLLPGGLIESRANALNDAGQIVGTSGNESAQTRACLWFNGMVTDLGVLTNSMGTPDTYSYANDINNAGVVVGNSGFRAAFLWTPGSRMKDLNTLIPTTSGWVLTEAKAINNRGQIVGAGTSGGQSAGFLLTPVFYDFDGDARADIVFQNPTTREILVWFLEGGLGVNRGAIMNVKIASGWQVAGMQDLNLDGNPDLLFFDPVSRGLALWFLNKTNYAGGAPIPRSVPAGWEPAGLGDFNRDGAADLLLYNPTTRELEVWFLSGAQYMGAVRLAAKAAVGWRPAGVADFNGDGNTDILFHDPVSRGLAVWLMDGTNYAGGAPIPFSSASGWQVGRVADYNGDGKVDILFHNPTTRGMAVWFLDGTLYAGGAPVPASIPAGWQVVGR